MNSKSEIVKNLLKENIEELNRNTKLYGLTIKFENEDFYVFDKYDDIIMKNKISEIDTNFESQKKFILNVINKITTFAKVLEDMNENDFKNLIKIDNKNYFDVLGYGDIYKNNYTPVNVEKLDSKEINKFLDFYTKIIKRLLDKNKIRIVLYKSENRTGFYIDGTIHKDVINLSFTEDLNKEIQYKKITLCYKITTDEEINNIIKTLFQ